MPFEGKEFEQPSGKDKEHGLVLAEQNIERKELPELEEQLAVPLRHIEISRGAVHSPWMEEEQKLEHQFKIDLEAAKVRAEAGPLTDQEILAFQLQAEDVKRSLPEDAKVERYALHNFVKGIIELLLAQKKFNQALELGEKTALTPDHLQSIKITIGESAIEQGFLEDAEKSLIGVESVSAEMAVDILLAKFEKSGLLDKEWLQSATESMPHSSEPNKLKNYLLLAILLKNAGDDPTEIVEKIRETCLNEEWEPGDWNRSSYLIEFEKMPFEFYSSPLRYSSYYPVIREEISPGQHALLCLLANGVIESTESLIANERDLQSQCLLAYYKAEKGLDYLPNLEQAHSLVGKRIGGFTTLISLESRLGLLDRAEETLKTMSQTIPGVVNIIARCDLASAHFIHKEGNKEKAKIHLEAAIDAFEKAKKIDNKVAVRLALKLAEALHIQGLDTTSVLCGAIKEQEFLSYHWKIIETAQKTGADILFLLEQAESVARQHSEKNESFYNTLTELAKLYQEAGLPAERFFDEIETLYNKADIKEKKYIMYSITNGGLDMPQDRRLRYYRQYFVAETMTEDYSSFSYHNSIDKALNRGDYRAAWEALFLPDSDIPKELTFDEKLILRRKSFVKRFVEPMRLDSSLIEKIFEVAIKAKDYSFFENYRAMLSSRSDLAMKMAVCDALKQNDFSLLDSWLEDNVKFQPEDLRSKKEKKSSSTARTQLEQFAEGLAGIVGDMVRADRIQETAQKRIEAARLILIGLREKLGQLSENEQLRLFETVNSGSQKEKIMLQLADEFELLGIGPNSSWQEVKMACMRIVRRMHPDAFKNYDPQYEKEMKEKGIYIEDVIDARAKIRDAYVMAGLYKS